MTFKIIVYTLLMCICSTKHINNAFQNKDSLIITIYISQPIPVGAGF